MKQISVGIGDVKIWGGGTSALITIAEKGYQRSSPTIEGAYTKVNLDIPNLHNSTPTNMLLQKPIPQTHWKILAVVQ